MRRPLRFRGYRVAYNFNPRTHEECDLLPFEIPPYHLYFNPRTHEECDTSNGNKSDHGTNFNPRTHEECDAKPSRPKETPDSFQSTHSRGVRHTQIQRATFYAYFNPRTHEECDTWPLYSCIGSLYFNPRTHEECDYPCSISTTTICRFQSTHSRGVRRIHAFTI